MPIEFPAPVSLEADEALTEELARANLAIGEEIPDLYSTGVRYEPEPRGQDKWILWPDVLRRGFGDCEDLVAWLLAWLWQRGHGGRSHAIEAPGYGWHQQVVHDDGTVEDPSRALSDGAWKDLLSLRETENGLELPYEVLDDEFRVEDSLVVPAETGMLGLPALLRLPAFLPPLARAILLADSIGALPPEQVIDPLLRRLAREARQRSRVRDHRPPPIVREHRERATGAVPEWLVGPVSPISVWKSVYMAGLKNGAGAGKSAVISRVAKALFGD